MPEGKIHQITTKKTYLLLEQKKLKKEKYIVLPFQTTQSFPYKIITDSTLENIEALCAEQFLLCAHQTCHARGTGTLPEDHAERFQHFLYQLDDAYQELKPLFQQDFDTTQPLQYRTLRPKDWAKNKLSAHTSYPAVFFQQLRKTVHSLIKDRYWACFDEQSFWEHKQALEHAGLRNDLGDLHTPLYQAGAQTSALYSLMTILFGYSCALGTTLTAASAYAHQNTLTPPLALSGLCGLLLADTTVSIINFLHSRSSTTWAFAPGLIGTLREMYKNNNFYDQTSRKIF